jgi:hypothetical protein
LFEKQKSKKKVSCLERWKFFQLNSFISGIFSSGGKGQLILAGDPKQLGPILRSPIALKYGLQLSLLERLMDRDVYGRGSHLFMENSAKTYADSFVKYLCFTKNVYDECIFSFFVSQCR